jgi:hypothetical protein
VREFRSEVGPSRYLQEHFRQINAGKSSVHGIPKLNQALGFFRFIDCGHDQFRPIVVLFYAREWIGRQVARDRPIGLIKLVAESLQRFLG